MGGLIASEFTYRHTDIVTKLILLNSVGLPVNTRNQYVIVFLNKHISIFVNKHISIFDITNHNDDE